MALSETRETASERLSVGGSDRRSVCAVCGAVLDDDGAIEDSNGWRWFSDGRGGLHSLCPTCPVPTTITGAY